MDVYRTEEEQVEAIRAWWRENGRSAIFGVALGLAAIFGWRGWQAHEAAQAEAASVLYQELVAAARAGRHDDATARAGQLTDNHARSPYAVFAQLVLAGLAVESKDLEAATRHLEWALARNETPALKAEIALRLGRVRLARQEFDAALALLTGLQGAAAEELRGDIETARGNVDAARAAYGRARTAADGAAAGELLELKLEALGPGSDA